MGKGERPPPELAETPHVDTADGGRVYYDPGTHAPEDFAPAPPSESSDPDAKYKPKPAPDSAPEREQETPVHEHDEASREHDGLDADALEEAYGKLTAAGMSPDEAARRLASVESARDADHAVEQVNAARDAAPRARTNPALARNQAEVDAVLAKIDPTRRAKARVVTEREFRKLWEDAGQAVPKGAQAAFHDGVVYLVHEAIESNRASGRSGRRLNRVNFLHEFGHAFQEVLPPETLDALRRQHAAEAARAERGQGGSDLFDRRGRRRADVDHRVTGDFNEWFAERIGWANEAWLQGRTGNTAVERVAGRMRHTLRQVYGALTGRRGGALDAAFRDFLGGVHRQSAEARAEGVAGAQAARRDRPEGLDPAIWRKGPVRVAETAGGRFWPTDPATPEKGKVARTAAKAFARDPANGIIGTHVNGDTGWPIEISRTTADHAAGSYTSSGVREDYRAHLEAMPALPALIRNAIKTGDEAARHDNPNIARVHTFHAPVQIGNRLYRARLSVREYRDGNRRRLFYDHSLFRLEEPGNGDSRRERPDDAPADLGVARSEQRAGATMSVADLFADVKPPDADAPRAAVRRRSANNPEQAGLFETDLDRSLREKKLARIARSLQPEATLDLGDETRPAPKASAPEFRGAARAEDPGDLGLRAEERGGQQALFSVRRIGADGRERWLATDEVTRSPGFRERFGNSKVVDPDTGRPVQLFHGTAHAYGETDPARLDSGALVGPGVYMTEDPGLASEYATQKTAGARHGVDSPLPTPELGRRMRAAWAERNPGKPLPPMLDYDTRRMIEQGDGPNGGRRDRHVRQAEQSNRDYNLGLDRHFEPTGGPRSNVRPGFARIERPFDMDAPLHPDEAQRLAALADYPAVAEARTGAEAYRMLEDNGITANPRKEASALLQRAGYDGVTHEGGQIVGEKPHRVWIAFHPDQVIPALRPGDPEARFSVRQNVQAVREAWKGREDRDRIAGAKDGGQDRAGLIGRSAGNRVGLDFGSAKEVRDPKSMASRDLAAMPFVIEAGGDKTKLAGELAKVNASTDPTLARDFAPVVQHAITHFDRLNPLKANAEAIFAKQRSIERRHGIDTAEVGNYVPRRLELPENRKAMEPSLLFDTGVGQGSEGRFFVKGRAFETMGDAIAAGYRPKSTNLADLVHHRVEAGQRIVQTKRLVNQVRTLNAPDGRPIIGDLITRGPLLNGKTEKNVIPPGYEGVEVGGARVAGASLLPSEPVHDLHSAMAMLRSGSDKALSPLGYRVNRQEGAGSRQLLQSAGVKTAYADSPAQKMRQIAENFSTHRGFKSGATPVYAEMKRALENGDDTGAADEILNLGASHDGDAIRKAVGIGADGKVKPQRFTDSAEHEAAFVKSLTPVQKAVYAEAQKEHVENARKLQGIIKALQSKGMMVGY